jgi:hypothetical protein
MSVTLESLLAEVGAAHIMRSPLGIAHRDANQLVALRALVQIDLVGEHTARRQLLLRDLGLFVIVILGLDGLALEGLLLLDFRCLESGIPALHQVDEMAKLERRKKTSAEKRRAPVVCVTI